MGTPRTHAELREPVGLRPRDHVGWCYGGDVGFDDVALPYLAEGLAHNQLVCYVHDDPRLDRLRPLGEVRSLLDRGALCVASVAEAYGGADPGTLAERFDEFAAAARAQGFSAVRSATDVTSLVARVGADRWIDWERTADATCASQEVVALCAYDRRRLDATTTRLLASVHPSVSVGQRASFRIFSQDGAVHVCGSVDAFSAARFSQVLHASLTGGPLVVDLSAADFLNHSALMVLHEIASGGVTVVVLNARPVHRSLWRLLELPLVDLRFDDWVEGTH